MIGCVHARALPSNRKRRRENLCGKSRAAVTPINSGPEARESRPPQGVIALTTNLFKPLSPTSPGGRQFPPTKPHLRVFCNKMYGQVWRRLCLCTEQRGTEEIFSSGNQEVFERWALALAAYLKLRIRGPGAKFYHVKRRRERERRRAVRALKIRTRLEREARLRKLSANARKQQDEGSA
jgi:hypothetical protein